MKKETANVINGKKNPRIRIQIAFKIYLSR